MAEELAVIKDARFGVTDRGTVALSFTAATDGGGALQVLPITDAAELIADADVRDVQQLNGRAIVVQTDGMLLTYDRLARV